MHYKSIRNHLKPYAIVARRKTTVNHAFASAIAPSDDFDDAKIRAAMELLGQDPDQPLWCTYCGALAQTWDHVFATVQDSRFSGYGHRLGNLLPCCKSCNSAKGNKDWRQFLAGLDVPDQAARESIIQAYLSTYAMTDSIPQGMPEYEQLQLVREQVLTLLGEADRLAKLIRDKAQ